MVTLREIVVIHDLHRQGLGISAIARQTGLDRKTVRKYLKQGLQTPRHGPRQPRPRLLDRLLHHAVVIQIEGASYRLRKHADLIPEHVRANAPIAPPPPPKRRGRPRGKRTSENA